MIRAGPTDTSSGTPTPARPSLSIESRRFSRPMQTASSCSRAMYRSKRSAFTCSTSWLRSSSTTRHGDTGDRGVGDDREACAQKLRAAARAEECGLDADGVAADASGVPTGAARRQTPAARKAKGKTKDAFDKGRSSPTQAGAIADAAEANPAAEESLLDLAQTGSTTDLLDECERVKREATDDASLAAQQRRARFFRAWKDHLGMLRFAGAFEPLVGAKFVAELERRAGCSATSPEPKARSTRPNKGWPTPSPPSSTRPAPPRRAAQGRAAQGRAAQGRRSGGAAHRRAPHRLERRGRTRLRGAG